MNRNSVASAMDVSSAVLQNLRDQHDWTSLDTRCQPGESRTLIRGLPPRRLYIHPDDQINALAGERATGQRSLLEPEFELVLPVHLSEKMSLSDIASVFDSVHDQGAKAKRIVLATVHNDSTVSYYIMHEGMVKPRQN
jgi:tRNA-splicing endonuclease subunit Sen15